METPAAFDIDTAELPLGMGEEAGWYVRSMFSTRLIVAVWFL
jgi:hypothetical protein